MNYLLFKNQNQGFVLTISTTLTKVKYLPQTFCMNVHTYMRMCVYRSLLRNSSKHASI